MPDNSQPDARNDAQPAGWPTGRPATERQWRQTASHTARTAAHEAAAAGQRAAYWELLALSFQLAGLSFTGDLPAMFRRTAQLVGDPASQNPANIQA